MWRAASLRTVALSAVAVIATTWAAATVVAVKTTPFGQQPGPDSFEYADGAWQLGHGHSYVTFFDERTGEFANTAHPPRYPFGTSVALAPFAAIIDRFPEGPQIGARVIAVLYVLAIICAAWCLGGPTAAAIGALLVGFSPFTHVSGSIILSDALAALLTVGILIALAVGRGGRSAAIAGALAGALVCVRLLGVVALPALLLALPGRRRWVAAAFASPPLAALALYQWNTFGSPFRTGYSYWLPKLKEFSPSFVVGHASSEGPFVYPDKLNGVLLHSVCPCGVGGPMSKLVNLVFYPSVLAGLFWVFAPPLSGLVGLWGAFTRRAAPAARFALIMLALNLGLVLFYWDRAARFVAPAAALLTVYAAMALADAVTSAESRVIHRHRGTSPGNQAAPPPARPAGTDTSTQR